MTPTVAYLLFFIVGAIAGFFATLAFVLWDYGRVQGKAMERRRDS